MKYTLENKLRAIKMVLEGNTIRSVSNYFHIGHHNLYEWMSIYETKGEEGLCCPRKRVSDEEKHQILLECQESDLPLYQIASRHGLSSTTVNTWLKKASRQGKPSQVTKEPLYETREKVCMKPPTDYEKEYQKLLKENERLRAENLLLKKVKALVEEREAQNRKIGRGPSKN